jgi:FlaA1/EpsC-like NDP-sugar epimerase
MVTGSAGSIGTEICRQLLHFSPRKLILVDRSENGQFYLERELSQKNPSCELEICVGDVTDRWRMRSLFEKHCPDIVFHAAAYKHVPLMESNPGEALKNIVLATSELADLAEEYQVGSFVMISTDKAVRPTSIMGACKRAAELYLQMLARNATCRFITVRFGNVLDSAGSVIPIFREQISRGGPVTVTDPRMERYFMTIPEASQLVIQAGAIGQANEIFVLDMGEPVQIVDLAADMIRLSGLRLGEDIEIEFTGMRPGEKLREELYSDGERHLPTWHPKIMVAEQERVDADAVEAAVQRFGAITEESIDVIVAELRRIVPDFNVAQPALRRLAA